MTSNIELESGVYVGILTVNGEKLLIYREDTKNPNDPYGEEAYMLSFYLGTQLIGKISISAIYTDKAFLYDFTVKSQYRSHGYGSAILVYVLSNYKVNELAVRKYNTRAVHFYQQFGFNIVKEFDDGFIRTVLMKLDPEK